MNWLILIVFLFIAFTAKAQDTTTTINYSGQPPPSAMAPGMTSFSQDLCAVGISGAVSTTLFGFSSGGYYQDKNCERIKLSKQLETLGLKVAAVAVLAEDERVWNAMMMSGTPPPIDGLIGDAARNEWIKRYPERFKTLYGTVPAIVPIDKSKE